MCSGKFRYFCFFARVAFLLLLFCSCCFVAQAIRCFFAGCCLFADDFVLLFCFVASLLGTLHCFFALLLCCCCFFACVAFLLSKNLLSNKATQAKKQLSKQWVAFLLLLATIIACRTLLGPTSCPLQSAKLQLAQVSIQERRK